MRLLAQIVKLKVPSRALTGIPFHGTIFDNFQFLVNLHVRKMGSILSCGNSSSYSVTGSKTDLTSDDTNPRKMSTNADFVESVVCKEADIPDEGMKEFEIEGSKIIVAKTQGTLAAVGGKCSHYGAPLSKGAICNGSVRCPFHGACFNLKTGDIEDFPGLDSIPTFQVEVANGNVKVKAKRSALASSKRVKEMAKRDPAIKDTFVVIGGGAAGAKCVETLRQEGFSGRVILIGAEEDLPYDRIKLSKFMHTPAHELALRTSQFYQEADIELKLGCAVVGVSASEKNVRLSTGETIPFDKCLIATGGRPRRLSTPGCDLKGVYILRTPSDANAIVKAAKGKDVIIVGTSFIGMEAAAYFASQDRAASVTIIGSSAHPFERSLGAAIGARLQAWFEEKGVKFVNNASVTEIKGEDDAVSKVLLNNGSEIDADLVLAGIGVTPSTEFLQDSGVELNEWGYIPVNEHMETNIPGVFSGGDIASFPLFCANNRKVCIGHWQMAHKHGHVAALNMVGKETAIKSVPFFWTMVFGKSVRYAGHGAYDDVVISGDLEGLAFIAYYCKGDEVVGVASLSKDPAVARFANYVQGGRTLTKDQVLNDGDIALKLTC